MNAILRLFAQRNAGIPRPPPNRPVAIKGPLQASFFMGMDRRDTVFLMKRGKHINRAPHADYQLGPARFQCGVQFFQRVPDEIELTAGMFGQRPITGLKYVKREDRRAARHRRRQGCVIVNTQIPLEPYDMHARHGTNIEQTALFARDLRAA
nr:MULTISPECIES: hypothetical protein [Hyphomonas]